MGSLRKNGIGSLCLLALFGVLTSSAAGESLACSLDVPVYGPKGERLQFSITAVQPEGHDSLDLLTATEKEYRVEAKGSKLYFQRALIGKAKLQLVLQSQTGAKIITRVGLMHCQQRSSVEYGGTREGLGTGDVAWSVIKGKITGCRVAGDWWIRAVPMFGSLDTPIIHEGFVDKSDGAFWIPSSIHGERHIIVIGREKDPLKVLAFDAAEGGRNDMGSIDMRDSCPK